MFAFPLLRRRLSSRVIQQEKLSTFLLVEYSAVYMYNRLIYDWGPFIYVVVDN